jgi:three-Cys-motif partner protein
VAALRELAGNYPNRRIRVVRNDANEALKSLVAASRWRSTRAVLFLDPYGMQLEWSTLEKVAATKAIDVWFLFSLAGLYRQATRQLADIDEHKRAALTRMFGSDAWEKELYPRTVRDDLFDGISEEPRKRSADVSGLEAYAKTRLETIFAAVLKPLPLPLHKKPQRFSLFLCISNDDPKAIGLARKIGNHILRAGNSS